MTNDQSPITNVIQTVILTAASILIAGVAYAAVTPERLAEMLPPGWTSLSFPWRLENAEALAGTGYAGYELFGALVLVWVIKGLLLNLGGPGQMYDFQLFLATQDPRDAAKVGAAWSGFLVVRWAMAMGIALLAITGIQGVSDPERVMPVVLHEYLPAGIRGLVIAGLLAAFMSTFSATVNSAASYLVRDWWQPIAKPGAESRALIRASYASTLLVVIAGTVIGLSVPSIGRIFSWIMMELGAAWRSSESIWLPCTSSGTGTELPWRGSRRRRWPSWCFISPGTAPCRPQGPRPRPSCGGEGGTDSLRKGFRY